MDKHYCIFCGRTATMKLNDIRVNETSWWCDYHSEAFVLITQFNLLIAKGITDHYTLARKVDWNV